MSSVIDSSHKMAQIVANLVQYHPIRNRRSVSAFMRRVSETPTRLGFRRWWNVSPDMKAEWRQATRLNDRLSIIHLCRDRGYGWYLYHTRYWRDGVFRATWDQPAIVDNVSFVKRLAGMVGAQHALLTWAMENEWNGRFTGEFHLCKHARHWQKDGMLMRGFASDRSFRIAWFAEEIEQTLYENVVAGTIFPLPGYISRGAHRLKDHMGIAPEVPEAQVAFQDLCLPLSQTDLRPVVSASTFAQ